MRPMIRGLTGLALAGLAGPALAEVTLLAGPVTPDTPLTVDLRLSGGCKGAPTSAVRVGVPEALTDVKPAAKAGWTATVEADRTVTPPGQTSREPTIAVIWTAATPSAAPDDFSLTGTVTDAAASGTTLYFPVTQDCGAVSERWTDIPVAGKEFGALSHPAPAIQIATLPIQHKVFLIAQLRVTQPWIDATAGATTDAYLDIENRGGSADRLVSAAIAGAEVTVEPLGTDDTRAPSQPLEVPPNGKLTLKPNAAHLALRGLQHGLRVGDTVPGTLRFERAGPLAVDFDVTAPRGN